ncbi:phasin family protein [Tsuneonella sp. HG249]
MATQAEPKTVETKADAAAEKAYAAASETVSPKKTDEASKPAAKIDAAVAEVKAAPKKAKKTVRKAKPAAAKKVAAPRKPATPKKIAAKVKPAAKPAAPRAAKPSTTTTVSKLKDRIMATAKTTDFTASVKNATAEAQTRAKAAYEKLQAYAGEMTEVTKGNVEAVVESGKILGAGVQDIARSEVEAAKGAFETLTADLKAMAAVKSPTELFKLQGEIARRNFDMLVARTSKNAEVGMKLANDAFAPISSRMSLAAERLSKAA